MTWRVHFNNGVFSASRWHKKDIMFSKNYFSAIQDGVSAHVHAVSVGASTFLTITQASFQQMLLLTSVAWHQVRNSDREPNCLKAIGCSYLQAPFCAAQKICMFFVSPFQTCNSLWHGTNYFIIIRCVFCLLFLSSWPWGHGSCVQAADCSSLRIAIWSAFALSQTSCSLILR